MRPIKFKMEKMMDLQNVSRIKKIAHGGMGNDIGLNYLVKVDIHPNPL